jgi:hypothetical protein
MRPQTGKCPIKEKKEELDLMLSLRKEHDYGDITFLGALNELTEISKHIHA